MKEWRR